MTFRDVFCIFLVQENGNVRIRLTLKFWSRINIKNGRTIYTMWHATHAPIVYNVFVYNCSSTLKLVTSGLLYSDTVP